MTKQRLRAGEDSRTLASERISTPAEQTSFQQIGMPVRRVIARLRAEMKKNDAAGSGISSAAQFTHRDAGGAVRRSEIAGDAAGEKGDATLRAPFGGNARERKNI
jgi:hypothetical protein